MDPKEEKIKKWTETLRTAVESKKFSVFVSYDDGKKFHHFSEHQELPDEALAEIAKQFILAKIVGIRGDVLESGGGENAQN